MVVRSRDGSTRAFPVVETVHRNSILLVTEAPAHIAATTQQRAQEVAQQAISCLEGKLAPPDRGNLRLCSSKTICPKGNCMLPCSLLCVLCLASNPVSHQRSLSSMP